jgi:hypothetical protein
MGTVPSRTGLSFTLDKNATLSFEFVQKDLAKMSPNPPACTLGNDLDALFHEGSLSERRIGLIELSSSSDTEIRTSS